MFKKVCGLTILCIALFLPIKSYSAVTNEKPVINVKEIYINEGEEFDPMDGVTAYDLEDGDLTKNVYCYVEKVNNETINVYYDVLDSDVNFVYEIVKVNVNMKPVFNYPEEILVFTKCQTIEEGIRQQVTVSDKEDGDISRKLIIEEDTNAYNDRWKHYVISAKDSNGNLISDKITVKPIYRTCPGLSISGDLVITVGKDFNPLEGVTAYDDYDGDITSHISVGNIPYDTPGVYNVEYSICNSKGKVTSGTRKVIVQGKEFQNFTCTYIGNLYKSAMGKGEPGANIKIYDNNKIIGQGVVNSYGYYNVNISNIEKDSKITIEMNKVGFVTKTIEPTVK